MVKCGEYNVMENYYGVLKEPEVRGCDDDRRLRWA
jgi:hypothetical protein